MQTRMMRWAEGTWQGAGEPWLDAHLVLVFGAGAVLRDPTFRAALRTAGPRAEIVGCSTAGEILGDRVTDQGAVALAVAFDTARVRVVHHALEEGDEPSFAAGLALGRALATEGLRHVLVLSSGLKVNGSRLVEGLRAELPAGVSATGGLAGDGSRFHDTTVLHRDHCGSDGVIGVGFYGDSLEVHWGTAGGWEAFGPRRHVTRSEANVLYELDGKPALELYKTYLGERAAGLPATGLLFPLELLPVEDNASGLVRTILAVDESTQSLTFAGEVPEGRKVRLMKSTIDKLVWGAETAAEMAGRFGSPPDLALLVSCVGRRLVLDQRVEEEVEAVLQQLGHPRAAIGFYSYGEIGPGGVSHGCELHNQTMALTTLRERPA